MKVFLFLITFIILINPLFAAQVKEEWRLTAADISLIKDDGKTLKVEGTLLGKLLELNKRNLWSMMEEDGTILTLMISYLPMGQSKTVNLVGFYRTFSLAIQYQLEALGILYKPVKFKIAYLKDNPFNIRFFVKGSLLTVPPLITKND